MPRINKKTRIKGLPPKLQLDEKDNSSGSFPTKVRIASDNRNGLFNISYDDTRAANFVNFFAPLNNLTLWVAFNSGGSNVVEPLGGGDYLLSGFTPKVGLNANRWPDPVFRWFSDPSPSFPPFDPRVAFPGSDGYENFTAADFFPPDNTLMRQQTNLAGATNIFSPISASTKPFSVSFFLSHFSNAPRYTIAAAAADNAYWEGTKHDYLQWAITLENGKLAVRFNDSEPIGFVSGSPIFGQAGWISGEVLSPAPFTSTASYRHICITSNGVMGGNIGDATADKLIKFYVDGLQITGSKHLFTGSFSTTVDTNYPLTIGALGTNTPTFPFSNTTSTIIDAFIDEFMFFDRELTGAEVSALMNLTHAPTGTQDGQLGNELAGMFYGTSFETSKRFYEFESEQTTNLFGDGTVRKGVADGVIKLVTGAPGQDFQPFRDFANPAVDAISKGGSVPFYSTGSDPSKVSTGFSQPLWSKTKIEIDITPKTTCQVHIQDTLSQSSNHTMAYWNKDLKVWQGIGNGNEFGKYTASPDISTGVLDRFCEDMTLGFGGTMDVGGTPTVPPDNSVLCRPISNFGFPHHPKFAGTSSNHIKMSDYINEPFLLEKVVLYWSGSQRTYNYRSLQSNQAITTFFILNERNFTVGNPVTEFEYFSGENNIQGDRRTKVTSSNTASISRDLVTYLQMSMTGGLFSNQSEQYVEGLRREFNYRTQADILTPNVDLNFTGQFEISGVVKSPIFFFEGQSIQIDRPFFSYNTQAPEYIESWRYNGRNATNDFGRNLVNAFESPEIVGSASAGRGAQGLDNRNGSNSFPVNEAYDKPNPYLLFPTDKLILGWQLPYQLKPAFHRTNDLSTATYEGVGPTISWSQGGIHKVVLYGSQIREGVEFHDTLNQLLSTNAIHEVIGE